MIKVNIFFGGKYNFEVIILHEGIARIKKELREYRNSFCGEYRNRTDDLLTASLLCVNICF